MTTYDKRAFAKRYGLVQVQNHQIVCYASSAEYFAKLDKMQRHYRQVEVGIAESPEDAYQTAIDSLSEWANADALPSLPVFAFQPPTAGQYLFYVAIFYNVEQLTILA